jgi:hypothetical protein
MKSSLDKIFYKIVYHHIIYMCDFFDEFIQLFTVVCTGFHEVVVCTRYVPYINRWKDSIRSNILLSGIFKLKLHVEKDGIINELRNCWR